MSQNSNIEIKEVIKKMVHRLFQAENYPGNRKEAEDILASDYLPITRAKGQIDRNREDTLSKIANPNRFIVRHADQANIEVDLYLDNHMAIVRSLLSVTNSELTSPTEASYRNMHIFLKRDRQWKCIAWQVTKVDQG
jgi:hypothetical protein